MLYYRGYFAIYGPAKMFNLLVNYCTAEKLASLRGKGDTEPA